MEGVIVGMILGYLAFVFFFLGDYNDWKLNRPYLKFCFPVALIMLIVSIASQLDFSSGLILKIVTAAAAVFFIYWLYHALFVALKPDEAYGKQGEKRSVCTKKEYAVCRHPGVIFFVLMLACFVIGYGFPIREFITYSLLDTLLALFEDRIVFPAMLEGYEDYQKSVPFLLPDFRHVKN